MTSNEIKAREVVQSYFDLFNAGDGAGIAALFADDAQVVDPVGTKPKSGMAEILEFYKIATRSGTVLKQVGSTRAAFPMAAFAFEVHVKGIKFKDIAIDVELPSGAMMIEVIDVFEFNDDGKIKLMQAYWGPSNITQKSQS